MAKTIILIEDDLDCIAHPTNFTGVTLVKCQLIKWYFASMRLEEIAIKCLVNSGLEKTNDKALRSLHREFATSFPSLNYEEWNKEIPETMAQNIVSNVGKNGTIS